MFATHGAELSRELITRARNGGETVQEQKEKAKLANNGDAKKLQSSRSAPTLLSQTNRSAASLAGQSIVRTLSTGAPAPFWGGMPMPRTSTSSIADIACTSKTSLVDTEATPGRGTWRSRSKGKMVEDGRVVKFAEKLEVALTYKLDLDFCEKPYFRTALWEASWKGHTTIVRLLVANRASVCVSDCQGRTPLHEAAYYGRTPVIEFLLRQGHPVDCVDDAGQTPLFRAVEAGRNDVAKLLIANGASANVLDNHGTNVQHAAMFKGYPEMSDLMLRCGAVKNRLSIADVHEDLQPNCQMETSFVSAARDSFAANPDVSGTRFSLISEVGSTRRLPARNQSVTSLLNGNDARLSMCSIDAQVERTASKKSILGGQVSQQVSSLTSLTRPYKKIKAEERLANALAQQEKNHELWRKDEARIQAHRVRSMCLISPQLGA